MDNNKFDNFYNKKSIKELIEKVRDHRISNATMDKEWHEKLLQHLEKRELSNEQKIMLQYILNANPETLVNENKQLKEKEEFCPFCKKNIQLKSIKCEHCGKSLVMSKNIKNLIISKTISWIISVLFILLFSYKFIIAFNIHTDYGYPALSPGYMLGVFAFCAILPFNAWIITLIFYVFLRQSKKEKKEFRNVVLKQKLVKSNENVLKKNIEKQNYKLTSSEKYELISKLKSLLDSGALTKDEFDNEKQNILNE